MKVKLNDILFAIESMDQDSQCFLDKETGEIVTINDSYQDRDEIQELSDMLDSHGFIRLPDSEDKEDYRTMVDFAWTCPEKLSDCLLNALSGRGAFRYFKDTVYEAGVEKDWYAFQEDHYRKLAIRWCEDNSLEYEEN